MIRWNVSRRLLWALLWTTSVCISKIAVIFYVAAILLFAGAQISSTDPARTLSGPLASVERVADLRERLGLDRPFFAQFGAWSVTVISGDFGWSAFHQRKAVAVVADSVGPSLLRIFSAVALGTLIGAVVGLLRMSGSRSFSMAAAVVLAIPAFTLAACALWLASALLRVTPLTSTALYEALAIAIASVPALLLVALTVGQWLQGSNPPTRTRQYLEFCGASSHYMTRVLLREAAPAVGASIANAMVPVMTAVTMCEVVFSLRGFGFAFVQASQRGDVPVMLAGMLVVLIILVPAQVINDRLSRVIERRTSRVD